MRFMVALVAGIWSTAAIAAHHPDKAPTTTYDPYTKTLSFEGKVHNHNALLDPVKTSWWLDAAVVDTTAHNPMLVYDVEMPQWCFFEQASDIDGNSLKLTVITRQLSDLLAGDVHETVGVELPLAYAEQHIQAGLNIKVIGRNCSEIVIVPADALEPFITFYDSKISGQGSKSSG